MAIENLAFSSLKNPRKSTSSIRSLTYLLLMGGLRPYLIRAQGVICFSFAFMKTRSLLFPEAK
jgi:hypothetical protein